MENELLGIEEVLKAFRNILLGNKVIVYTDHIKFDIPVFQF